MTMPIACSTPMMRLRYQSSAAQPKSTSPLTIAGTAPTCLAPGGQDLAEPSTTRMAISRTKQAAEDERGAQKQEVAGEHGEHARQIGAHLGAPRRMKAA